MARQREATTNRLVDIIASIKMERRSGQLTVRRGEGPLAEEGMLIFREGQITRARVGRRIGPEALNWLSTWGQTHYLFSTDASDISGPATSPLVPSSPRLATYPHLQVSRIDTDRLDAPYPLAYGVPYATIALTDALQRIEQARLSRAHRRLYLLIDGHRSAIDLVPLSGRTATEVRRMLYDLEWLGIIRIANPPAANL